MMSPSKTTSTLPTVKPSPSKRQKMEDEDDESVSTKKEIKHEVLDNSGNENNDDFLEEENVEEQDQKRRKAPVQLRVGDIFRMAHFGTNHRPGPKDFESGTSGSGSCPFPRETDPNVISRRAKQIEYGKGTAEYKEYIQTIARDERLPQHPKTPNMHRKYSRRAWDGLIRLWRCNLHIWDQDPQEQEASRLHHLRSRPPRNTSESFSTGDGESTSTASSVMGEGDGSCFSEAEDLDQTIVKVDISTGIKVKGEIKSEEPEQKVSASAAANRSWYDETLEFEEDYLDLDDPSQDEFEVKVKTEV